MTNHNSFDELDRRATTAAAEIRAQAEVRPVPPFDAEAPIRLATPAPSVAASRQPLLAAAAVLALVIGGLAWWTGARSEEAAPELVATTPSAVRPFVATDLPTASNPLAGRPLGSSQAVLLADLFWCSAPPRTSPALVWRTFPN